jgi:hypothetical protein
MQEKCDYTITTVTITRQKVLGVLEPLKNNNKLEAVVLFISLHSLPLFNE